MPRPARSATPATAHVASMNEHGRAARSPSDQAQWQERFRRIHVQALVAVARHGIVPCCLLVASPPGGGCDRHHNLAGSRFSRFDRRKGAHCAAAACGPSTRRKTDPRVNPRIKSGDTGNGGWTSADSNRPGNRYSSNGCVATRQRSFRLGVVYRLCRRGVNDDPLPFSQHGKLGNLADPHKRQAGAQV